MTGFTNPRTGAKRARRLCVPLALAASAIVGTASGASAETCYMMRLTQVELNAAGGASDFAVPNGPNQFQIVVKPSWPDAPDLMNYAKFTFALLPGVDPAVMPLIKAAGGVVKLDGNYAGGASLWQANTVSTQTYGWPTPDPKSSIWPNDYPNQVWFESNAVQFQNCSLVRSQIATLTLDGRELLRFTGDVPRAGCQDCPQLPQVQQLQKVQKVQTPDLVVIPSKPTLHVAP
jgi:hypothetical protein